MKPSLRTPILIGCAIVLAGSAVLGAAALGSSRKPALSTVAVTRGDLTQTVTVSGQVKAAEEVQLAFERSGSVARTYVKVGDQVAAGQALVALNAADLQAQLAQAEAGQAAAQARLDALQRGARGEAVDVQSAGVAAAQTSLDEAKRGLVDKLQASFAAADDAVRGKSDQLFLNPTSPVPSLGFFVADAALSSDLSWKRLQIEQELEQWQAVSGSLSASADLDAQAADFRAHLNDIIAFTDEAALAVDKIALSANPQLTQPAIDGYKASLSLARANLLAANASVSAGLQQAHAAQASLNLAESQKTLATAAATPEDLAAQQASVRQAAAAVLALQVQLSKTVLRAPIAGIVTRQDAEAGEIVMPNAPVAGVITSGAAEIDAIVPEADVADVRSGETAAVTLDAYGTGTSFAASVVSVDPSETQIGGSSGYKVTLAFDTADDRVKPGMTANVAILVGSRAGVLKVPAQAVIQRDGQAYVLTVENGLTVEKPIVVGARGADGTVEVTSGLSEGEIVASYGAK